MKIENKNIGLRSEPFIIDEMSGNHNHSLERDDQTEISIQVVVTFS